MEQRNVRGRNPVQWNVLHRKPYWDNWVFCFFIYCRPTRPELLWHFRCLIFYSLTLTELIQKVNACFTFHVCLHWAESTETSSVPPWEQSEAPQQALRLLSQDMKPGFSPHPGRLLSVRRQYSLTMPSSPLEQHKEWGWEPQHLPEGFCLWYSPLLIPSAVKLAGNIDFLSLVTEMEW